jgi:DNA repair exonuclease SbcCD ATPase subunit
LILSCPPYFYIVIKRACSQAKEEHDELHSVARQLETRTLQCETEIKTVQMQKLQIQEEKNALQGRVDELQNTITQLKAELEESSNKEEKATLMQKEQMELLFSEKSLRAQADKELEDSKKVISQFTSTVSDQEALVQQLNQVVKDLREKNSALNVKLQESFSCLEQLRRETNQQITSLEMEKQKLVMRDTTNKEEIAKIKLDYSALEKQLEQLSKSNNPTTTDKPSDEAALPQRKIDRNDADSTKSNTALEEGHIPPFCIVDTSKSSPFFTKHTGVTETNAPEKNICSNKMKEQHKSGGSIQQKLGAAAASDCYICSKQPFGIMRMCQCGLFCGKRAHMSCIIGRDAAFCCDK